MKKHRHHVAIVFAYLFGGLHTVWSALVLLGLAQPLANFIAWAHMFKEAPQIGSFDLTAAISLIVVTAAIGYALGFVGSTIWHKVGT